MMKPIGAVLGPSPGAPGRGRRARDPVRRGSRLAGTCEGAFWRRTDRQEVRQVVLAAKRYELAGRQAGRRNGPLGHVALEVLELLANLVAFRTGRLEPAITTLMGRMKRSKDAVVRALASLRAHGFLDWLRRHERVEVLEDGPGPRVRQVSNAYRLSLPARAAKLLGHWLTTAGPGAPGRSSAAFPDAASSSAELPDDLAQEREERAAWTQAHRAALSPSELPLAVVEDDRLARVLGELGRAVEARARAAQGDLGGDPAPRDQERGGAVRS